MGPFYIWEASFSIDMEGMCCTLLSVILHFWKIGNVWFDSN